MVDFWIVLLPFPQLQLAKKNCLFGDQLIQNLGTKVSYFAESIELENVREYIDFFLKKTIVREKVEDAKKWWARLKSPIKHLDSIYYYVKAWKAKVRSFFPLSQHSGIVLNIDESVLNNPVY